MQRGKTHNKKVSSRGYIIFMLAMMTSRHDQVTSKVKPLTKKNSKNLASFLVPRCQLDILMLSIWKKLEKDREKNVGNTTLFMEKMAFT